MFVDFGPLTEHKQGMAKHNYTFDHPSDIGLAARADSLGELMEALAEGLAGEICDRQQVRAAETRTLEISTEADQAAAATPDYEALAVDFLTAVMNLIQVRHFMVREVNVEVRESGEPRPEGSGSSGLSKTGGKDRSLPVAARQNSPDGTTRPLTPVRGSPEETTGPLTSVRGSPEETTGPLTSVRGSPEETTRPLTPVRGSPEETTGPLTPVRGSPEETTGPLTSVRGSQEKTTGPLTSVRGSLTGEPYDPGRHEIKVEIKAVTYHQLTIKQEGGQWVGRVIVDI
jgi:SHS2 domain-containing protein